MENNTNKIIELANGKKYLVIRQIYYKGKTYYVAGELLDNEEDLTGNVMFFEETKKDEKSFVKPLTDQNILKQIGEHFQKTEIDN